MLHHFSRCEGSWAGETEWRQGQRSDTSPGGAQSWTFPVDESYMANIANHLWMVEPLQKMWYSLYQLVHDFFHQYHFEAWCLKGKLRMFLRPTCNKVRRSTCPQVLAGTILVILGSVLLSHTHMDVSENSGTPKSSILIGFSLINHPFWGTPIFGNTHMTTSVFLLQMSFFMILTWVFKRCFFCSTWTLEQNQVLTSCPVSTTLMSLFLWWKSPTNALKSQQTTFLDLRYSLALSYKKWETNSVEPFGTASPSFLLLRIARLRALSLTWWRWRLPSMWSFQLGQWRQLSTWYDTWRPRFL